MKKLLLLCAAFATIFQLRAQNNNDDGSVHLVKCERVGISRPLSELFEANQQAGNSDKNLVSENFVENNGFKVSKDRENRKPQTFVETHTVDPVLQTTMGQKQAKTLVNWAGQSDGSCPPDPTGAVGINHYVQAVNASPFKVFDKTSGATIGTVRQIGSLWSPATVNDGDPIILYDKFADRWFISQMGWNNKKIYIAISTTNDPTGT